MTPRICGLAADTEEGMSARERSESADVASSGTRPIVGDHQAPAISADGGQPIGGGSGTHGRGGGGGAGGVRPGQAGVAGWGGGGGGEPAARRRPRAAGERARPRPRSR